MPELQVPCENSQPLLPTSPVSSGMVGEAFGRRGEAKEQDLSYVPLREEPFNSTGRCHTQILGCP